jgi:hypothetical protein
MEETIWEADFEWFSKELIWEVEELIWEEVFEF